MRIRNLRSGAPTSRWKVNLSNWGWLRCVVIMLLSASTGLASGFGDVRGVVRDPQQHVVTGATVTLGSRTSHYEQTRQTNDSGEFFFRAIPIGEYLITIEAKGFGKIEQAVTVISDSAPILQIQLELAPLSQQINVKATPEQIGSDSATPTALISRDRIEKTPGADRTNSLSMIINYVPGAYTTHDQLHVRGGHQVTWLVDGVPVANTNIASNVGPQFDPKDIDYLEVQRGSYSSEYGDRTYGIFNIVPRTGFERKREAELVLGYGNFHQTNDQINFGSHSDRFAYYASVNGTHSDFGLQTPSAEVLHDEANGVGGFASLIYNATTKNQLRLVAALRGDNYQVPNDADAQIAGIRDVEREKDAFVNFSWVRTISPKLLLTTSPFYHFNRADFIGGDNDFPFIPQERRSSQYAGAQIVFSALTREHSAKAGLYGFFQQDNQFFGLTATDGSGQNLGQRVKPSGYLEAVFLEDQYKPVSWLTLSGGLRFTHFSGAITENVTSPRVGAAIRLPRLNWVLRGFYGRYYQAPPLSTVSGPLLEFAVNEGFDFLPLRGERDEELQYGLAIPLKGWLFDGDYFRTRVKNFFDHSAIGESNIFFPLTIDRARIRGFELSVRSPQFLKHVHAYLTYSHQRAEGSGGITGGLTDFSPGDEFFFLDHDQRHTLNVGGDVALPRQSYVSTSVHYGSGFVNGEGPDHLTGHTTFDLSAGKAFGENWSVALHAINVADNRYLLDNSETFGGTHFVEPRQVYVEVRYRFHY
jgi:outer membrane receptor for ferrienterochelin and colicin